MPSHHHTPCLDKPQESTFLYLITVEPHGSGSMSLKRRLSKLLISLFGHYVLLWSEEAGVVTQPATIGTRADISAGSLCSF